MAVSRGPVILAAGRPGARQQFYEDDFLEWRDPRHDSTHRRQGVRSEAGQTYGRSGGSSKYLP
jgi:hypothetical protein